MFNSILLLPLLTVTVIGTHSTPLLFRRQTQAQCSDIGQKTCGDFCIDLTDICCPDASGGCPITTYCTLGDNGQYGCCDIGKKCVGDGGVDTSTIFTDLPGTTSTNTVVLIPSETSRPAASRPAATNDDTSIAAPNNIRTSSSTSSSDDASVSTPLAPPSSRVPTSATTTRTPTTSTALARSTGAASSQFSGISGWLFAVALPVFAL
jgi:hypothetical protein